MKKEIFCPMTFTMKVIGGKWKLIIIYNLSFGVKRFSELQRSIEGITQQMLTIQLRELERDGVIVRKVYPVVPPKVEYRLSKAGEELAPIIKEMELWGSTHKSSSK